MLRASQYQRKKGIVEVATKNESSKRPIKVPPDIINVLSEYRIWWKEQKILNGSNWKGTENRLFIQIDGKPINPDTINYWLNKFIKKHGFEHFSPHSLRHTFATLQITSGVDLRTLQARGGWAQASTLLNIYSHAIKTANEQAADTLDAKLRPESTTAANMQNSG